MNIMVCWLRLCMLVNFNARKSSLKRSQIKLSRSWWDFALYLRLCGKKKCTSNMHLRGDLEKTFFGLCFSFLSLLLFICEGEWNEIVNLCSNCSIYTVIEVLYVCLQIHGLFVIWKYFFCSNKWFLSTIQIKLNLIGVLLFSCSNFLHISMSSDAKCFSHVYTLSLSLNLWNSLSTSLVFVSSFSHCLHCQNNFFIWPVTHNDIYHSCLPICQAIFSEVFTSICQIAFKQGGFSL